MVLLNYSGCAANYSGLTNRDVQNVNTEISVENEIIDTLYATYDVNNIDANPPVPSRESWSFNTVINAQFDGQLSGGNMSFVVSQVRCIRVKRSEAGSYKWLTLAEIPILDPEDLKFTYVDRYARSNQEYKYAAVPVFNQGTEPREDEGDYKSTTIMSDFDGVWFMDPTGGCNAIMDVGFNTTLNQTTSTVVTLGNRFPYVNRYGKSQYHNGEVRGTFVRINYDGCDVDVDGGVKYRETIDEFLLNGLPKIIKFQDGRIWMAGIVDAISKDESDYYKLPTYSVNFVETGRHSSSKDLYNNGFIDVNIDIEEDDDELLS